jgi:predicted unusual protein kinase regulating ubiquinone biosynthesis (AarF/ABC1/UbiB family)
MPSVAELMDALPEPVGELRDQPPGTLPELLEDWALRPVPVGAFRRLRVLGTLNAEIGAAYLFHWLRGWFKSADENQRLLAETHWRTALRVLDSMSYLRGATMKMGQTLANFPDILPQAFVETLERLHFDAPPMHWSLIKEMVHADLGDDPENLFASFQTRAFAAASLGQVHRARLKTGEEVAVKIQYPGIARTIRQDVRNLLFFLLPARLSRDWESTKAQLEDLRVRLEQETDYEQEAIMLQRVRRLFHEEDGIVVPRVHREHSTGRILTMDYLPGMTLEQFIATNPSQEARNDFARKILRAWYRMLYAGRLLYADFHPGNFLFLEDGRLGAIDFGFMIELDETLWELMRKMDRPLTTGNREDRIASMKAWHSISDDPVEQERLRLSEQFADWSWRSRYCGGEFDFGDEADFRRGVDLFFEFIRKRHSASRPCTPAIARQTFGVRSILYRLKAKIDIAPLAEADIGATGWDRSDYAE